MDGSSIGKLCELVVEIKDPRVLKRSHHLLTDILGITILATLCGFDDCVGIALFATEHNNWLKQYFELPRGTPSHDTFLRVLGLLDPSQFQACLVNLTKSLQETVVRV